MNTVSSRSWTLLDQSIFHVLSSCFLFQGEVLYRVRWKNYCSDDDTWEPEAHLEDCREVLLAFKKAMADAKAKKEAEAKKPVVS